MTKQQEEAIIAHDKPLIDALWVAAHLAVTHYGYPEEMFREMAAVSYQWVVEEREKRPRRSQKNLGLVLNDSKL
jgi:hypothetical protein